MKKYFAFLFTLLLIISIFAGCQKAQTASSNTPSASTTASTSAASSSVSPTASTSQPSPSATVSKKPFEGKHLIWAGLAGYVPFRYFEDQKDGKQSLSGLRLILSMPYQKSWVSHGNWSIPPSKAL